MENKSGWTLQNLVVIQQQPFSQDIENISHVSTLKLWKHKKDVRENVKCFCIQIGKCFPTVSILPKHARVFLQRCIIVEKCLLLLLSGLHTAN